MLAISHFSFIIHHSKGKPVFRHKPCDKLQEDEILHRPCGVLSDSILVFEGKRTAFNRIEYG